ncbi:MAG: PrpF domain-containing protein [Pseudomonadota bacterium]
MTQRKTPAAFYRGGTSKGVLFRPKDLPQDPDERDRMLLHVLGSPDPYKRQLDGMGGGLSSLSKALWVERSQRNDADIDYTFAQIAVDEPVVDYSANCGNMSSAIAPFAVEEDVFPVPDGDAVVRMFNTNTGICIHSHFRVADGRAVTEGDLEIPGVPGTSAPIRLEFMDPSRVTGRGLSPTGQVRETVAVPGYGDVPVSIVDAAALAVFVPAETFGLTATESPEEIEAQSDVMAAIEIIRREAAVRAGFAPSVDDVPMAAPRIALVATPTQFVSLDGRTYEADSHNITVRMVSLSTVHRAVMVTAAMCLAAATQISGSVPNQYVSGGKGEMVRLGNPSGVTVMGARVSEREGRWQAESTSVLRTCRRLMDGFVYHP